MPGILEDLTGRFRHATAGGLIAGLNPSGGSAGGLVQSLVTGPFQSRLASIQAAGTAQAKLQALTRSLGVRLKSVGGSGGLLSGVGGSGGGGGSPPATDRVVQYQVSGNGRVYGTPTPPTGISFR